MGLAAGPLAHHMAHKANARLLRNARCFGIPTRATRLPTCRWWQVLLLVTAHRSAGLAGLVLKWESSTLHPELGHLRHLSLFRSHRRHEPSLLPTAQLAVLLATSLSYSNRGNSRCLCPFFPKRPEDQAHPCGTRYLIYHIYPSIIVHS